jgi:ferredoxin
VQRAGRRFRIEPLLCTECLFYSDGPACAAACPQDAVYLPAGSEFEAKENRTNV